MKKRFTSLKWLLIICLQVSILSSYAQSKDLIWFKSGTYALSPNIEELDKSHLEVSEYQGIYFVLVHFKEIPTSLQKNKLTSLGVSLGDYLPKNSFLAKINTTTNLNRLQEFGIDGIYLVKPEFKMSYAIANEDYPAHAITQSKLKIIVQNHVISGLDMASVFERFNASIISSYAYSNLNTIEIPFGEIQKMAQLPFIKYMEIVAPDPVAEDLVGETNHRMNYISNTTTNAIPFNGDGVWLAVGDDGAMGPHIDYSGRMDLSSVGASSGTHGDHVSGIMMGAGNIDPDARGMAWGADIKVYDVWDAVNSTPVSYFNPGVVVTSTSYGDGCNDGYTSFAQSADQQIRQMPNLMHVFSAGNSGTSNCGYGAGAGWGNITGGIKSGKNVLAVGNVTFTDQLANSSSRGPASDGRIKPDICANGTNVNSCYPDNQYNLSTGTSMAAPGVSGTYGALVQAYKVLNGGVTPSSDLVKGAMLNTADDLGNVGPDFKFGWGRLNARKVVEVFQNNSYFLDSLGQGVSNQHTVAIPAGVAQVKIMVYWRDYEGTILSTKALVNDLDMTIASPGGGISLPYVLDPTPNAINLDTPATHGVDSLNNMEQVVLDSPIAGNYIVNITGTSIPQGPQKYYVIYEFITSEIVVTYPTGGEGMVPGATEVIRWDAAAGSQSFQLEYSLDSGMTWVNLSTVTGALRQANFTVPNVVTGQAKIRVSRNGISGESKMNFSIIGVPTGIEVVTSCPTSFDLKWNSVSGATAYEVSVLGNKYMDSVITVFDTTATVLGYSAGVEHWVSVKAKTTDAIGKRAYAIQKQSGIWNCMLNDDIGLELMSPAGGVMPSCIIDNPVYVTVKLKNNGVSSVTNVGMNMQLDNGTISQETYFGVILPGDSIYFSFTDALALPVTSQRLFLSVWKDGVDDNPLNDTLNSTISIEGSTSSLLAYSTDFQNQTTCSEATDCGLVNCALVDWINAENGVDDDIDFRTIRGGTTSGATGPSAGHTDGSSTDKYVYLESSGSCEFMESKLYTPCFDLTGTISPKATIWYHMYGTNIGELHFDVYANAIWHTDVIPAIVGNQGNQWFEAEVDLTAYAGNSNVILRYRGITGDDFRSDIALDDFEIKETAVGIVADSSFCMGEARSIFQVGFDMGATFAWDFGNNATPSIANSAGPHMVAYTSGGMKQVSVTVTENGASQTYTKDIIVVESAVASFETDQVINDQLQFMNTTLGASSSFWEFGDGGASRQFNSLHTYALTGIYTVKLTTDNICGNATISKDLFVGTVGVTEQKIGSSDLLIYPNPSNGKVNIQLVNNTAILGLEVLDFKGARVYKMNENKKTGAFDIDLTFLAPGIYVVKVQTNEKIMNKKLVIK